MMVRYSDELIDEIKNKNDIVDVISQYVVLKRSGRNFFGLCPFHKEKSPSFSVSPDKQIFHCFGCGVGGNVFHFVQKIENLSFIETVDMLANRAGINLPTSNNNVDDKLIKLKSKVYSINEETAKFYHENLYKPTSKEAALLMLTDNICEMCEYLKKTQKGKILIAKVIDRALNLCLSKGDLSLSGLTVSEFAVIRNTMTDVIKEEMF